MSMPVIRVTKFDGIEVFDVPQQRALAIAQEYGPQMSTQKVAALLAASTNLTANQIERLPVSTYTKIAFEVMRRLNARVAAANR
ncbi:hypothetical protein WKW77_30680 [Variovorax ureilyticus]|uniref:Phage tail assembly chaperone protein, E, or 41 or 14 n=1 Tax=Variovorax ureilyticus TaxID=1836198 RepID=A0ABU8VR20_9BURK